MDNDDVYDHDKEMGFLVGQPDAPRSDWPVAVSMLGLFALVGFIVWVFAR